VKKIKEEKPNVEGDPVEDPNKDRFFTEHLVEFLKYVFSPQEKSDLGAQLAQCFSDCTDAEARLKSVATQIKSEIARIEGEMGSLSEKIRTGYEHRNVKCEKLFDYRLGSVTYTRLDSGEIYRERAMDEQERQQNLNLGNDLQETLNA